MYLFSDYELRAVITSQHKKMNEDIERYSNDEIMANDLDLLASNCYEKYYIEPVAIGDEDFDRRSIQQVKIKQERDRFYSDIDGVVFVHVDGITARFYYEFNGDAQLLKCRASTWSSYYPNIEVDMRHIVFQYSDSLHIAQQSDYKTKLMTRLQHELDGIKKGIGYVNNDVERYNSNLKEVALRSLTERKKKVEQFYELSKSFEIPLKKNDFVETHIPTKRRIITPTAKKFNNAPNYYISDAEYSDILLFIKHNCSTYERTPNTFHCHEEEDLRNLLLAALNGVYQGNTNGEAFRNAGKTDICIERENRAAFVAECKMWRGASQIPDALNQLDGYLTWRDCKTALILFVKNKDFLAVLDKTRHELDTHTSIRQVKELDRNEFECTFVSFANVGQLVKIRVFLFNLYSKPTPSKRK